MDIEILLKGLKGTTEKGTTSKEGSNLVMNNIQFQKMLFLYNAVNDGWSIRKKDESYIFKKNHEGKKEVFHESYLHDFVKGNFDMNKLLSNK